MPKITVHGGPSYAADGTPTPDGHAVAGEPGPELASLPKPSAVSPAKKSPPRRQVRGNGATA